MLKRPETSGEGSYTYHYNREERLKLNPRVKAAFYSEECHSLPCFFKRNKGLMFLLLDVLILSALFLGYTFFLASPSHTLKKDGYVFSLQAHGAETGVLVSFVVRAVKPAGTPEGSGPLSLTLQLGNLLYSENVELPLKAGTERVIRKVFTPQEFPELNLSSLKDKKASAVFRNARGSYQLTASIVF